MTALKGPRQFRIGDVLARAYDNGQIAARYVVIGWTAQGKLRMRRPSGTELTAWWSSPEALPSRWFLERTA